ncbi:MAG: hypothetical protein U1E87_07440 [Alphaproteobacteria bacterium]
MAAKAHRASEPKTRTAAKALPGVKAGDRVTLIDGSAYIFRALSRSCR